MKKTPRTLTAKDYRLMSAFCQLWMLVLIMVALLARRPDFAAMLFLGFWIGAACASYGAKSREQKSIETERSQAFQQMLRNFGEFENRVRERQKKNLQ